MSQMLILGSRTFLDEIEVLMKKLPQAAVGDAQADLCVDRLREMINFIRRNQRRQKEQSKGGCTKCRQRGRDMRLRRKNAKICNNCDLRDGNTCTVDGSDKRKNIVEGTCPKNKYLKGA